MQNILDFGVADYPRQGCFIGGKTIVQPNHSPANDVIRNTKENAVLRTYGLKMRMGEEIVWLPG